MGVRVACRLENASHNINGVRFGALPDGDAGRPCMVSEEIAEDVAGDLCRNPAFTIETFTDDQLEVVERDIEASAAAIVESAAASTSGATERMVEELQRANQAQGEANRNLQVENAELKLKLSKATPAEVDRLNAEVARLTAQSGGGGADAERLRTEHEAAVEALNASFATERTALVAERDGLAADKARLEGEVGTLKSANDALSKAADEEKQRLGGEIELLKRNVEELTTALDAATKPPDAPPADAPAPDAPPADAPAPDAPAETGKTAKAKAK